MPSSLRARLNVGVGPGRWSCSVSEQRGSGPLDSTAAFHPTGSARVLRVSRNASGRRCDYFDVTDRFEVVRGGIKHGHSIVYFRQFTLRLITTPQARILCTTSAATNNNPLHVVNTASRCDSPKRISRAHCQQKKRCLPSLVVLSASTTKAFRGMRRTVYTLARELSSMSFLLIDAMTG